MNMNAELSYNQQYISKSYPSKRLSSLRLYLTSYLYITNNQVTIDLDLHHEHARRVIQYGVILLVQFFSKLRLHVIIFLVVFVYG